MCAKKPFLAHFRYGLTRKSCYDLALFEMLSAFNKLMFHKKIISIFLPSHSCLTSDSKKTDTQCSSDTILRWGSVFLNQMLLCISSVVMEVLKGVQIISSEICTFVFLHLLIYKLFLLHSVVQWMNEWMNHSPQK